MRIAVLIIAYREEEFIQQCIKQWEGLDVKVLNPVKPWFVDSCGLDKTQEMCYNVEIIRQHWNTEVDQRNYGLARLYDYDWVIICDADEFYTKEDRDKIINTLKENKEICYRANKVISYWKYDYILDPPDGHKPLIAVNPKKVKIIHNRNAQLVEENRPLDYQPVIDVTIHHMSWSRPDHKIKAKIDNFSHIEKVKPNWYNDIWLKWTPDMEDIRPYGIEKSRAIKYEMPQEIKNIIK